MLIRCAVLDRRHEVHRLFIKMPCAGQMFYFFFARTYATLPVGYVSRGKMLVACLFLRSDISLCKLKLSPYLITCILTCALVLLSVVIFAPERQLVWKLEKSMEVRRRAHSFVTALFIPTALMWSDGHSETGHEGPKGRCIAILFLEPHR